MRTGIDCFHLACRFDDKISEIEAEYGVKGTMIIIRLWCKIYSEEGYFCEWNERRALLFLSNYFGGNSGVTLALINSVVEKALNVGVFSSEMYEKCHILTSRGIQKEYFKNVKRRQSLEITKAYVLVDVRKYCPNVNIFYKSVNKKGEIVYISEQRRVEESRGEERRGEERRGEIQEILDAWNALSDVGIAKVFSVTEKRKQALEKLIEAYGAKNILQAIENIKESDFLLGKDGKWKISFDFFCNQDKFVSILEGAYKSSKKQNNGYERREYSAEELDRFVNAGLEEG